MDVAFRIQQDIVRLDVPVHNSLPVYVAQRAAQLGNPETDGFFGKGLAGNVEAEVTAVHQVYYYVPAGCGLARRADHGRGRDDAQVFNVLEAVSQVAKEGVVEMLEHPSLPYNVAHAF